MNTALFFDITTWMIGVSLGFARLSPIFFVLPFFNSSVLNGATRNAVIVLVAMGFWTAPVNAALHFDLMTYVVAIMQELVIGCVLACLLAWPFWIFHAIGCFIDNQRGATLSSSIDPANGIDTSELANFFQIFSAVIYLQSGGMLLLSQAVETSYQICDPLQGCHFMQQPLLILLNTLLVKAIICASPVVITMLLSELTLGLLSRFAPQLNAFSISLTIKSLLSFFILLILIGTSFPQKILYFSEKSDELWQWFSGQ